jgi:hypothetical protein
MTLCEAVYTPSNPGHRKNRMPSIGTRSPADLAVAEHDVRVTLLDHLQLTGHALEESGGPDNSVRDSILFGAKIVLELELSMLKLLM